MYFTFVYSAGIALLELFLQVAGLFSEKIRRMRMGRSVSLGRIRQFRSAMPAARVVWFHAASSGEFEQAVPVIRHLKESNPELCVAVSFYSPSGFEQKSKNPLVDLAFYLPADRSRTLRRLVRELRPSALVLVKYEFWYHLVHTPARLGVPVVSICCILREDSFSFPRGWVLRRTFPWIRHFFVQNSETARLLREHGFEQLLINGDTRVDRVLEIRDQAPETEWLGEWKGHAKLLVIGSAWPEDLVYLQAFVRHAVVEAHGLWKLLVVPHETDSRRIDHVVSALQLPCELYSEWKETRRETDILVLNTTGMLSRIYRYADAAWIGGAFKTGLHNTLEAAVYGIPIGFGPRYAKFQEAEDLVEIGQARSFPSGGPVWAWFQETTEDGERKEKIREVSALYFDRQKGAGKSVARYLESLLEEIEPS